MDQETKDQWKALIAGILFLGLVAYALGMLYVALHFIVKYW